MIIEEALLLRLMAVAVTIRPLQKFSSDMVRRNLIIIATLQHHQITLESNKAELLLGLLQDLIVVSRDLQKSIDRKMTAMRDHQANTDSIAQPQDIILLMIDID